MSTPPLSPQDIKAAAEVHSELGPEYSDAVVQSFFERVDKEIQSRIEARMATAMPARRPRVRMSAERRRGLMTGVAIGGLATGIPLTLLGWWVSAHPYETVPFATFGVVIWVVLIAFLAFCVGVLARKPQDRDR